jgi:hypothetical protein
MSEEKKISNNNNLKELRASGYKIAKGEPDIRGWKVMTADKREIGKVKELLFDTVSLRVRYVAIRLNGKPLNLVSRNVLIPIGLAELDENDNAVVFPEVTVGHLASLPDYKKGDVTIATERAIRTVFAPTSGVSYKDVDYNDPEFYNHEYYNEERTYRSRRPLVDSDDTIRNNSGYTDDPHWIIPTKRVRKEMEQHKPEKKITETKQVSKTVQEGSFAPFQEGAIEIKEHSEVPVVSKEARVVEEVSVNKEVKEHNEKVKDSVRKTEVDVEKVRKEDL